MTIDKIGVRLQRKEERAVFIPFLIITAKSMCLTFFAFSFGSAIEVPSVSLDPVEISNATSISFNSSERLHQNEDL